MNTEQIEYVIRSLDAWLEERFPDIAPKKVVGEDLIKMDLASDKIVIGHFKHMIIEMVTMNGFSPDDHLTREKLMRWLGFLQGALWSRGYFSLDDLREMNVVEK